MTPSTPADPHPADGLSAIPSAAADPMTQQSTDAPPPSPPHGPGKIARLPQNLRDNVNQWLLDRVPYAEMIIRLGDAGAGIKPDNISEWKKFGHKKWLLEKSFFDQVRERQETPAGLARDFDATEVNQGALQLATLHIFEALRDLAPGSLDEKLGGDCASFSRLINSLARVSRETKELQKYRDACIQARALLLQMKDPKRKLNDSETRAIIQQTCDILGVGAALQLPAHGIYAIKTDTDHQREQPSIPANNSHDHGPLPRPDRLSVANEHPAAVSLSPGERDQG